MLFKDKDVICFLGDSITANDLYVSEIFQVLRHKANVKVINCGVSGGTADKAVHYLYEKCLNYNPDYVVTMFGINDVCHWLHSKAAYNDNTRETIKRSIENHKRDYDSIIAEIVDFGATPIICIPTPYDDFTPEGNENMHCQEDLDIVCAYVEELKAKYGCRVIDYKAVMQPMLKDGIISPDRIHPTIYGQHIIAQTFLCEVGAIDKPDFATPYKLEPWAVARHEAMEALHKLNYVEFCDIYTIARINHWNTEQKKQEVRRRLDNLPVKEGFVHDAFAFYLTDIDYLDSYIGETLRLSK